ncbi:putative complex 1 LYR protein [Helianthus annuus]|uniref:Complex 1 LYR protein n=1 Tax=Helianthus annuus TaxID=4232 RepID=A0A9K3NGM3_HELAN|nr:putative complex 1 LYR protein [Helianthus annuus]KAJ0550921.1 putative complex 1 LYR protein [Helianthus annuus]KAJ0729223.1 putative complex 1 LYR protein [Helianthus annuus]KAJ0955107.1 putative complex 1 LYR protein [Helianthus annuus]
MATAAPSPSRKQILSIFGSFLRSSRQFTDYNIREYTKRRTIDAFCQKNPNKP